RYDEADGDSYLGLARWLRSLRVDAGRQGALPRGNGQGPSSRLRTGPDRPEGPEKIPDQRLAIRYRRDRQRADLPEWHGRRLVGRGDLRREETIARGPLGRGLDAIFPATFARSIAALRGEPGRKPRQGRRLPAARETCRQARGLDVAELRGPGSQWTIRADA